MIRRIRPIVIKEFRQISRDRRTLGLLLFIPAFMLVMFGYALNFDVRHLTLAVCDEDHSPGSRELVERFLHSEYFELRYHTDRTEEIDRLMGDERIRIALVIPRRFSARLLSRGRAEVQVLVDGANASAAATAVSYVNAVLQEYSGDILIRYYSRVGGSNLLAPIDYRPRIWYNPELKSARFLVPGLIGFILMITSVVSTALSVVREKEQGTMEQLRVSPIRAVDLILGKAIPYVLISLLATGLILLASYALFDIVVRGSYALLFLATLVFLLAGLGLGMLISTVAESQQLAFQMALLVTMLPTFLLSGFVFPIRNMPVAIQVITHIVPARYYLTILRGIILKGVGLRAFWDQLLWLCGFATVTLGISAIRMRRAH